MNVTITSAPDFLYFMWCALFFHFKVKEKAGSLNEQDRINQTKHLERKVQARISKETDKATEGLVVAAFDLQQVLTCPKLRVGSAYYLRKMNVYNLTVLELQTMSGFCYTWNETVGKRGTNEIATVLLTWMGPVDDSKAKHVVLYSDTCGGQNRNKIMCTALILFLATAKHINIIEQKFFESGHSQCECDSMHSCIQGEINRRDIHIPSEYLQCMKAACKKKPYTVKELKLQDFADFEKINRNEMKQTAFQGILSAHHIKYEKSGTDVIVTFMNEIDGDDKEIKSFHKRGRNQSLSTIATGLKPCYDTPQKLDPEKKKIY